MKSGQRIETLACGTGAFGATAGARAGNPTDKSKSVGFFNPLEIF
jgi:hypothetical protein